MAKLSIYKYVRSDKGWRYSKATFHPNGSPCLQGFRLSC